jgi:hypothetical protein
MNRRGFFGIVAAAPLVSITPEAKAETAPNVVRADAEHRCACGSPLHHFEMVGTDGRRATALMKEGAAAPFCSWCGAPWRRTTA